MSTNKHASKATPDQSKQQPSTTEKVGLYALWGSLGTAAFSALAQIVVAWIQRH